MARKRKEEVVPEVENSTEQAGKDIAGNAVEAAAAEKPKRGRRKKADAEGIAAPAPEKKTRKPRTKKIEENAVAETVTEEKKTVTRRPRRKAVVPNFVIQNAADQGITYEKIVEKVKAVTAAEEVKSVDIYVKAEEGKAYYVVNGEMTGAVELF